MLQHKEIEQINWSQIFCRMYGLAMMLSISTRTSNKNIDKIRKKKIVDSEFDIGENIWWNC